MVQTILIVALCVQSVGALAYGFWRKFSRVTWIGWQILLLFAFTLLLDVVKPLSNGTLYFGLVVGALFLIVLLILGAGGLARHFIFKCENPSKGVRLLSRFAGAFTALVGLLVFEAVLGGLVLGVLYFCLETPLGALNAVWSNPVWANFLAKHVFDLFTISVFFVFVRAGFRLGLIRGLFYLLMFALTIGAVVGAFLLERNVGFIGSLGTKLEGHFGSLPRAAASVLGHGVIILVCFIVLFAVVMIIGALIHWLIRKAVSVRPVDFVSGLILAILFAVVFLAVACLFYYGVGKLAAGTLQSGQETIDSVVSGFTEPARRIARLINSSPLCRVMYQYNIFTSIFG